MAEDTQNHKQFYVISEVKLDAFHILRPESVVMLDPEIAAPLISANLIYPLLTAIKQGLYPPKEEKNIIEAIVEKVQETIKEAEEDVAEAVAPVNATPAEESAIVQTLKEKTKQRTAKSLAFENALKKKIQEKKKVAKQSSS